MASEVLASFFTIAGDCALEFLGGTEISPFDLRDRIEAASKAGYTGIGFGDKDLKHWGRVYPPKVVKSILADNGIHYVELEMLFGWYSDGEERKKSDSARADLLTWSEGLAARHIKVGTDLSDRHWDIDFMAGEFARLCAQAADVGTRIALEPMPVTTLKTPSEVLDMIDRSGVENGGVLLDIMHMVRGRIPFESLAKLPGDRVFAVELGDGLAQPVENDIVVDGTGYRRRPGDGEFDVTGFISAVRASGFDRPFGTEILSIENRGLSLYDAATLNFQAASAALKRTA